MKKGYQIFILLTALLGFILLILPGKRSQPVSTPKKVPSVNPLAVPAAIYQFTDLLEQHLDSSATVGAALTIVHNNQIAILKAYGLRKTGVGDSVDIHTVFRLASCSKGFAGVLACLLEQNGYLSLDDKVREFLPNFSLKDSFSTVNLSVKNTLSHTSGLVPHAYDDLIEAGVPLSGILDQLKEVNISAPPGTLYGYQNVIFSLMDTIAYLRTRVSYPNLLEQMVLAPLGMNDASCGPGIFKTETANFASPHQNLGMNLYRALPPNLGYYNTAPAAGVNASISDLSKWLLALLGNSPDILDQELLATISQPVIQSPLALKYYYHWGKLEAKHYGLGWRIYQFMGRTIIYHGGFVKGYRAEIAFCPEEKTGIAFLQNSPNYVSSICVPTFFKMYFSQPDSIPGEIPEYRQLEWPGDSGVNLQEGSNH